MRTTSQALPAVMAAVGALSACTPDRAPEPTPTPDPLPETEIATEDVRVLPEPQIACLARTAYHEARGEGPGGMAAVVHVVLNRTAALAYPDEPCAVVNQRRGASCQFSWACDGKSDEPQNLVAYDRALGVARAAAAGEIGDPTDGAVMFHARSVEPYWTKAAEKTAEIGRHVFYRLEE